VSSEDARPAWEFLGAKICKNLGMGFCGLSQKFIAEILVFLHELGAVVCFGSPYCSVLKSLVVLQFSVALGQPVSYDLRLYSHKQRNKFLLFGLRLDESP